MWWRRTRTESLCWIISVCREKSRGGWVRHTFIFVSGSPLVLESVSAVQPFPVWRSMLFTAWLPKARGSLEVQTRVYRFDFFWYQFKSIRQLSLRSYITTCAKTRCVGQKPGLCLCQLNKKDIFLLVNKKDIFSFVALWWSWHTRKPIICYISSTKKSMYWESYQIWQ